MTTQKPQLPGQAERLREAIEGAVNVGREFVRGRVDADHMATAMIQTVRDYEAREEAAGRDLTPDGPESRELLQTLFELNACGGGYLAGRCDAS